MNKTVKDRFWEKVNVTSDKNCWEWQASKMGYGYGQFGISSGKVVLAHRYSWIIHYGEIPNNLFVLHHCDNPSCVNPKHLFLGTQADNVFDMRNKGRHKEPPSSKGELNPRAKITKNDVQEILDLFRRGLSTRIELGLIFDVGQTTIGEIINGSHWACQKG